MSIKRLILAILAVVAVAAVAFVVWPDANAPKPKVPNSLQAQLDELDYTEHGSPFVDKNGGWSQIWTSNGKPAVTLNEADDSGTYSLKHADFGPVGNSKHFTCQPTDPGERLDYVINFGATLHQEYAEDNARPIEWSTLKCSLEA